MTLAITAGTIYSTLGNNNSLVPIFVMWMTITQILMLTRCKQQDQQH